MNDKGTYFSDKQLSKLFPFYLKIGRGLEITAIGPSLVRLCQADIAQPVGDHFRLVADGAINWSAVHDVINKPIILICLWNNAIQLSGELEILNDAGELIFIGAPMLMAVPPEVRPTDTTEEIKTIHPGGAIGKLQAGNDTTKATPVQPSLPLTVSEQNINCLIITDKSGAIEWVNSAFETKTGYLLNEIKGKRPRQVLYGEQSVYVPLNYVDNKIIERAPFSFQNVGYTKTHAAFWFRATVHPIINRENEISGRFSILEDISEIKSLDIELLESRKLWQFALEEAGHGVWAFDVVKSEFQFSPQYRKLLGYNVDEIFTSADWRARIHPDDFSYFIHSVFPRLSRNAPKFEHEHRFLCKNGAYRYFLTKGTVSEWGEDGKPLKTVGTLSDIDEIKQKDEALTSTSQMLSQLIKSLNEGIILETQYRKIALVNQRFCTLFSIPIAPDLLIGYDCSDAAENSKHLFRNPDAFVARVTEILALREPVIDEMVYMADGCVLQRDYIPVFNNGQYLGHLWKYKDVTDQVNAENKLKEQKEYYHKILNEIPADIFILNTTSKYEYLNKTAVRDEETRNWLIGKDDYDYCALKGISTDMADKRYSIFSHALNSKTPRQMVEEIKRPDGTLKYALRIMHPHLNQQGNVELLIGYGIDITVQLKNEKAVIAQEKRIRNLLEIINDGVFRCSDDGAVSLYNRSFLKIMGIGGEKPDKINFYAFLSEHDLTSIKEKIALLYQTLTSQSGMFRLVNGDGVEKYVDYSFSLPLGAEDVAFEGRLSDITEVINKEKNLNAIIEKEKELNNTRSRFIRITSHELRTPLSVIHANSEILSMILDKDSTNTKTISPEKILARINKESLFMTEILNQLMMVSRIETGKIELITETENVSRFLADINNDLYSPYSDGRELTMECPETIPDWDFDKKLMRQAIVNLLNNAFKYSPGRKAPVLRASSDDNLLTFEIEDYGIGIPNEDIAELFNSFYRASNVGVIQGTGLGLMVVDYAVKKHNGTIKLSSKLNEGTTFTISLPKHHEIEKG